MWQAGGGGGLRALRERFGMHEWAPPTAGVNFVVLGRPVGVGSTEALPADGGAAWLEPWPGGPELPAVG